MALYADRVKQSLGVTGTGTITLTLATTGNGYQSFLTAFGTGTQTVAYCIADQTGPNWEVGTGSYNGSANTLARTTVLASSNGGSLTNFSGGTQDVFCTAPAAYLLPPGANTEVGFNNAGIPGANANFTYISGTNTVSFGNLTGSALAMTIQTKVPVGSDVAGLLEIKTQDAVATDSNGGEVLITSGDGVGAGNGGSINIYGGIGGADGGGSNISIQAGNTPAGQAGGLFLQGGETGLGYAGNIELRTQTGDFAVGSIKLIVPSGTLIEATENTSGNIQLGFYGSTPINKPAVTGSRSSGAALTSLLTRLANLGLITNSTTA